jgi:excisionase family DNA binding protein
MENLVFTQLSIPEFRELFRQELSKFFEQNPIQERVQAATKKIFNIDEFCQYAGLSKQTVYKKTGQGLIPHAKRGKRLYFDKDEIDAWLLEHQIKPITGMQANRINHKTLTQKKRR